MLPWPVQFSLPTSENMAGIEILTSSWERTIAGLIALWLAYLVCLAAYRLYLSPLAKFPGPKLAALTLWYEFYYDVVKGGKYTWKIGELHEQYGESLNRIRYQALIYDLSQDQLCESIRTKFTSTIQTTTVRSILGPADVVKNGLGPLACSAIRLHSLAASGTSCIADAELL